MTTKTLTVEIKHHIAHVILSRPEKMNALNETAWQELQQAFTSLDDTPEARVIILQGAGKHFCAGIDLALLMSIQQRVADACAGRQREKLRRLILALQAPINAIEQCSKPVLVAIHGGCIGAGVDIVSACDMRYATSEAYFTIKEIDMGMVADLGTLQRLPKLIGDGLARELAYTGRKLFGPEAQSSGLVNRAYPDQATMQAEVLAIAETIAAKSPLSIRGTKEMLRYTRDHSVEDGLNYAALWNAALILSDDLNEAFQATMEKRSPEFKD